MDQSSRAERKIKRRKTNRILNTAIAVVLLLIVIVGFTIFAGGNEEEPAAPEETQSPQQEQLADKTTDDEETTNEQSAETATPSEDQEDGEDQEEVEKELVVKESTEPNVEQEIIDPNWESIGTTQSGQHVNSYEIGSEDWQEKEQALAYATGIAPDNMTVWFISGNGPEGAIGTVSPKSDPKEAYRVFIEWVEGEGWKPTKVQKLKENDKGR